MPTSHLKHEPGCMPCPSRAVLPWACMNNPLAEVALRARDEQRRGAVVVGSVEVGHGHHKLRHGGGVAHPCREQERRRARVVHARQRVCHVTDNGQNCRHDASVALPACPEQRGGRAIIVGHLVACARHASCGPSAWELPPPKKRVVTLRIVRASLKTRLTKKRSSPKKKKFVYKFSVYFHHQSIITKSDKSFPGGNENGVQSCSILVGFWGWSRRTATRRNACDHFCGSGSR